MMRVIVLAGFILFLQGYRLCHSSTGGSGELEVPDYSVACRNDTLDVIRPKESISGYSCNDTDVDDCGEGLSPCANGSVCVNTEGSYNCICPEGYSGDGRQDGDGCRDINECNGLHDCLTGATCTNGDGSYACECPSGFGGDGRWPRYGQGCIDIDECALGLTDCASEAICINTAGSYYCRCPFGYSGDARQNSYGCIDINECEGNDGSFFGYNNCMIGAMCINTNGSFTCNCPDGYIGNGRWFSSGCSDINECALGVHNCDTNEICFNTRGSFRCESNSISKGVQHLKFLNIFADDGVPLQQVEATSWGRTFNPIYVDGGIPIGTKIETTIYINTNGIISFGEVWPFSYPTLFPISSYYYYWLRGVSGIVAPFWNRVDLQREGNVVYKVFSGGDSDVSDDLLDYVSRFVSASDQRAANFSGTWMLVVDWNSVPPSPQYYYHYYLYRYYNTYFYNYYYYYNYNYYSYYYRYYREYYSRRLEFFTQRNTFQAIIITDNTETYTVFLYNCDLLQWTGYWRHAAVGYSVQTTDDSMDFDQFVNHPLSLRSSIRNIACQNIANDEPWSNIVYKIGESRTTVQQLRAECKRLYREDMMRFQNLERAQDSLLPCPCSLGQMWWDRRYRFYTYSYSDRRGCYIQRFPSRFRATQLCCYSYESNTFGALVGEDRSSGSSMLRYHPYRYPNLYDIYDRNFRDVCCEAADLCRLFYSRRPSDDCSTYRPPIWTWGRGDPHITSLDGRQYTFNGWGEYTLIGLNGSDFMLQCRTEPVVNSTATRFSGFAFGVQNDSVVEVTSDVDSGEMRILYNSVDISSNVTSVNDTYGGNMVDITRTDNTSIVSVFSNGLAVTVSVSLMSMLSIVVNVPVEYDSQTQGLMGNFNGNSTDDFIFPNGSMLDDGATDRMIHIFGQAWEISAHESLFTYPDGLSAHDFSHPDHIPDFPDEILANADSHVRELCNDNAECIFDVTQTGNEEVGMATLEFDRNTRQGQMESNNKPPRMIGPSTFMVTLGTMSKYVFNATDKNDFNVSIDDELFDGHLSQDGDIFTFILNLTEFENKTLTFIATDDLGAIAFLQPQLLICPCENNGNCTTGGLLDTSTNPLLMNCVCNPVWTGRFCEEDADGCLQSPCAAEVSCTDIPAPGIGAVCGPCPNGFSGNGQECVDMDECSLDTDDCEQECVNTEGNYTCQCFPNYSLINATHCEDIDECSVLNGGCHQQCTNTLGSYHCSCNEGYQLQMDGSTCEVRPEYTCSAGNSCNQVCVLLGGIQKCSCNSGYQLGGDGQTCIDINECELDSLACAQICNNTDSGYSCDCFPGYTLSEDGRSCNDVDECVTAALEQRMICPHSAYCVNIPGHYQCTCPGDTLLQDGECIQSIATTPAPQTTVAEPSTEPIPVSPRLSTVHYVVIAAISASIILLGLVVIMITLNYGKCCSKKKPKVEPMVIQNDELELNSMAIVDLDSN